ncbi:MAG: aldo/keto reductase [Rhodospirillales bacterium]|nr:aldo/keto reductase [Rhodospirillales bacterium]
MKRRRLGGQDPEVSAIGLGCMGMTIRYGELNDEESVATIHRAIEAGVDLINTADAYGQGRNEELVGRAIRGRRDRVILTTKVGNIRNPDGTNAVNGRQAYVKEACEASLKRLGTDYIDLYCLHRVDPATPIEETVGAMAELVTEGKVRHIGLSEAGPQTLRRAHAVHPMACLETEYSLWSRDVEAEILPACRELGIGFVAYAPLGRGFLAGTIRKAGDLIEADRRRAHPRFAEEAIARNLKKVEVLEEIAREAKASPAQVALAWLLHQGEDIVPIPGTKRRTWLDANIAAADLRLGADVLGRLAEAFPVGGTAGERYPPGQMKRLGL